MCAHVYIHIYTHWLFIRTTTTTTTPRRLPGTCSVVCKALVYTPTVGSGVSRGTYRAHDTGTGTTGVYVRYIDEFNRHNFHDIIPKAVTDVIDRYEKTDGERRTNEKIYDATFVRQRGKPSRARAYAGEYKKR